MKKEEAKHIIETIPLYTEVVNDKMEEQSILFSLFIVFDNWEYNLNDDLWYKHHSNGSMTVYNSKALYNYFNNNESFNKNIFGKFIKS
jgi:hypothetical protein